MESSPPRTVNRHRTRVLLLGFTLLLLPRTALAEGRSGEQIYRQQCASCHGEKGEGSDENYPKPLAGTKSVDQLARLIAKSMPKDAPKKCTGEDAQKVAAYIYEAFYSEAAQARKKPPRIELSRLTVRQYRHAVADLLGSFRSPGPQREHFLSASAVGLLGSPIGKGPLLAAPALMHGIPRGLWGEYFKWYRIEGRQGGSAVLKRIDPEVRFDFGVAKADPGQTEAGRFAIRWTGSVLAPDTSEYEFIVRTEHAVRLWVNSDIKQPLIDAGVKSGNDTEYRASIFLLGGRAYPLRLEFIKGRKGDADKPKKTEFPDIKASIALAWKRPQRTEEVVPQRYLTPNPPPPVRQSFQRGAGTPPQNVPTWFVVETPFPPDDRSVGYERGTSVSKAWDQATTDAAIEAAGYVLAHLAELSGGDTANRVPRLREFCRKFAERAFRRPLTDEQKRLYVDHQFETVGDPEAAVKRVVLLVLKSPRFLYREVGGGGDAYDVASRLSFGLWDSLPDAELLQAAAAGKLATREQVARQAERMVRDPRAQAKLRDFFLQWLKVDPVPDLAKDPKQFPGFDRTMASDLRTSLELFLDDVLGSSAADFRQLLRADYLYLNGRLAKFYGADLPPDAPFQKVSLKTGERAGVLTHPYLMATFAYTVTSSPIHRGVFLARSVLGRGLRPPPEAFTPLSPDLHPSLTTRERVTLQTRPQSCQACHGMINSLGFTLEHFDAIGRYRDKEKERPIDATGAYLTRKGEVVKFAGVRDLAGYLAGSAETQEAFVEQLFHCLVKQPVRAFGADELAELRQSFARNDCNIRKLMVQIMAASALPPPAQKH
jgi:mono/diheme cytochrome c family protein